MSGQQQLPATRMQWQAGTTAGVWATACCQPLACNGRQSQQPCAGQQVPGWQQTCPELDCSAAQHWGMMRAAAAHHASNKNGSCCDLTSLPAAASAKRYPSIMVALTCHCGQGQHSRVWLCYKVATQCKIAQGRRLTLDVWRSLISALFVHWDVFCNPVKRPDVPQAQPRNAAQPVCGPRKQVW